MDCEETTLILVSNVRTSCLILVRSWLPTLSVCTVFFNISCTESSPNTVTHSALVKGNQAPAIISAKILTDPIPLTGPVVVQVDAQDPDHEAVSFEYKWYVNNVPVSKQTGAALPSELLKRGQTVFVDIIPSDGTNKGQPYRTKSVVVGNTVPKVTAVSLMPQMARTGDKLEAQVEAGDPDHDRVDLIYKWYRNDTVIKEGEEPFLDMLGFAARDKIAVEVMARDPAGSGNSLKSDPLVLWNSAPTIISTPPISASQDHFDYFVEAVDPDGDRLTYQLEVAPVGMSMSEESGHIVWQIPLGQQGTSHVKVVVKDGQGGIATQEFDLTLASTGTAKPPGI